MEAAAKAGRPQLPTEVTIKHLLLLLFLSSPARDLVAKVSCGRIREEALAHGWITRCSLYLLL